jgi:protein ImuB
MRLEKEGKGLRTGILSCYRVDGKVVQVQIGTTRASFDAAHLLKLFELKIPLIEPALGIELFLLQAIRVEDVSPLQEALWAEANLNSTGIAELLDRIAGRVGADKIKRYLPQEHYWPEGSIKLALSFDEKVETGWNTDTLRPVHLLPKPEPVEVSAPVPDYPPMLFRYKGEVHQIKKADGPERIESEWWLETGEHRDYYQVEDEKGGRYWLFRLGHYSGDQSKQWFIHGFFA